jgi:pilus assembly protein CpaB
MSARWIHRSLIVVLLFAGSAVLLAENFGAWGSPPPTKLAALPRPKFNVVQARRNVARGATLAPADLAVHLSDAVPAPGTFARVTEATGRVATTAIAASEPISERNTASADALRLANLVPPDMRAVALRISEETAVANLVRPGDRVDVLMTSNPVKSAVEGRSFAKAEARVVLQDILVLAIGDVTTTVGKKPEAMRNVTLAVTPRQAAMVALIRSVGTEYLSLRSNGDEAKAKISPVFTDDLQADPPAAEAAPRAAALKPATRTVEIISGASSNRQRVAVGGGQ